MPLPRARCARASDALASGIVTASHTDIHDSVFDEIEERISTLQSGAPTSALEGAAWTQAEADAELAKLQSDKSLLMAHWKTKDGVVAATTPERARVCGQPQPCPHVLGLAQQYGLI
jgi:hypothetical protein